MSYHMNTHICDTNDQGKWVECENVWVFHIIFWHNIRLQSWEQTANVKRNKSYSNLCQYLNNNESHSPWSCHIFKSSWKILSKASSFYYSFKFNQLYHKIWIFTLKMLSSVFKYKIKYVIITKHLYIKHLILIIYNSLSWVAILTFYHENKLYDIMKLSFYVYKWMCTIVTLYLYPVCIKGRSLKHFQFYNLLCMTRDVAVAAYLFIWKFWWFSFLLASLAGSGCYPDPPKLHLHSTIHF